MFVHGLCFLECVLIFSGIDLCDAIFILINFPTLFPLFICRLHPGHRKKETFIRDCQNQVLLRLLILVALPMSTKITTTLSLLGIIGHLRLFLVC